MRKYELNEKIQQKKSRKGNNKDREWKCKSEKGIKALIEMRRKTNREENRMKVG